MDRVRRFNAVLVRRQNALLAACLKEGISERDEDLLTGLLSYGRGSVQDGTAVLSLDELSSSFVSPRGESLYLPCLEKVARLSSSRSIAVPRFPWSASNPTSWICG
jgi:hypothetical protein